MQYLLDTNICIFFFRGKLNLDEIIKQKGLENCYLSEITVFELRYGAENSNNPTKSHKAVDIFKRLDHYSNLWQPETIRKGKGKVEKRRQAYA